MADRPDEGFLPPEPAGPEPELGQRPTPAEPPTAQWQQPPPAAGQWPPPQPPPGWQPPPASWAGPPPGWQPPPPGQPWAQPPQQPWAYPQEPDNNQAVTGFVLAMVSIGLWFFSAGLSSLVSLGLAIAGVITSRRGKRKVEAGETRKHKGLAQAGFICSWIILGLSALSTLGWAAFFILLAVDEGFRNDLDDGNNDSFGGDGISTTVRLGAAGVRLAATLLS